MRWKTMVAIAALAAATPAMAAETTWTAVVSDEMCGASHDMASAGETAKQCTLECAKQDGSYVLVIDGKVYAIANPMMKGVEEHAGEKVKVTGTLKGKEITITRIEAAS